jgi:hypothetical protein
VLAFSDGGSESVGESRSRVALYRTGLPKPVLQWKGDLGLSVVRWTWAGLAHFTPVADRLRRRLGR